MSDLAATGRNVAPQAAFRVLVVDDDPDMAALLAATVQAEGMHAEVVSDGSAAIAAVADAPPDLVLLDVVLPGACGFEICGRLKTDPADRAHPGGAGDRARGPQEPGAGHRGRGGRFPLEAGAPRGAGGADEDAAPPARDAARARGAAPRRRGRAQGRAAQGAVAVRVAAARRAHHRRGRPGRAVPDRRRARRRGGAVRGPARLHADHRDASACTTWSTC